MAHYSQRVVRAAREAVSAIRCGNPQLPVCPECQRAGRTNMFGETPHLVSDGALVWCEACRYEGPGCDDIDPDSEQAKTLLAAWDNIVIKH